MNKKNLINNIEYCSIEHAANLLDCSVSDIEHFLITRAVGCYVLLLGHETNSDILLGNMGRAKFEEGGTDTEDVFQKLISTELSFVECLDVSELNSMIFNVSARLEGLWSIVDHSTTVELLSASSIDSPEVRLRAATRRSLPTTMTTTTDLNDFDLYVYGFDGPMGLTKSDIKILGYDLLRLYGSLYEDGNPLPNIHNNQDLRRNTEHMAKKRAPRTEVAQSDMIKALLCLLPDLKSEMDRAPTLAPDVLDAYLEKHGLPKLTLGDNNYRNWMNKAKYHAEN
ncbi:TPA: hypothetical protein NJ055_000792 [Vibrio parahaemolyticus]|uniref:hypothetical protein n=1 Tax=Vibrio alginolyticus TaxID=663 RepID=UPI003754412A|nr:hypothetical protein [Vibrio parahaemolyticus]